MLCMTNLHDINGQINTGLIWISYNSLQHRSFPTAYNHPWTWGAWCGCPEICPAGGRRSIALLLLFHLPGIFRQMVQGWQRVLQLPPRYIREVVKKRSFNGQADRKGWPPSPPLGKHLSTCHHPHVGIAQIAFTGAILKFYHFYHFFYHFFTIFSE